MINHSLIAIALMAFSIASTAAVTPMDVSLVQVDTTPAVLHKDVNAHQGGADDKDVAISKAQIHAAMTVAANPQAPVITEWRAEPAESDLWQSVMVWLSIIGLIVFFVARKSDSAK